MQTSLEQDRNLAYIQFFLYLQVLDFLSTLAGFQVGAVEASPFIRWLIQFGPAAGVALSKVAALMLAGVCIHLRKYYLIRWICYWYAALVVWNLCIILVSR
jgi:hypothetical protein